MNIIKLTDSAPAHLRESSDLALKLKFKDAQLTSHIKLHHQLEIILAAIVLNLPSEVDFWKKAQLLHLKICLCWTMSKD